MFLAKTLKYLFVCDLSFHAHEDSDCSPQVGCPSFTQNMETVSTLKIGVTFLWNVGTHTLSRRTCYLYVHAVHKDSSSWQNSRTYKLYNLNSIRSQFCQFGWNIAEVILRSIWETFLSSLRLYLSYGCIEVVLYVMSCNKHFTSWYRGWVSSAVSNLLCIRSLSCAKHKPI